MPLWRKVEDIRGEATTRNNIGVVWKNLGEPRKALEFYEQALPLLRKVEDIGGEATTLNNIGLVWQNLGEQRKALEFYEQALPLLRKVEDIGGEATTLNNIGSVWQDLGEPRKALEFYEQALPLQRKVKDIRGEATTLNNIGWVWQNLGEPRKALEFYEQALPLRRKVEDIGGEATTLNNFGLVWQDLGEPRKALEFYEQALPLRRKVEDIGGEATTLNNIGGVWQDLGEPRKALEFYEQALPLWRKVEDIGGEATTLNNIGRVWLDLKQSRAAVAWLKLSVNTTQSVRSAATGISARTDRTVFESVRYRYDALSDLLLTQGRIAEVGQVFAMLEGSDFRDRIRNPAVAPTLNLRLSLTRLERKWLGEYEAKAKPLGELGREREELARIKDRLPEQERRLKELDAKLAEAQKEFQATLDAMSKAFQNPEPNANDIDDMRRDENLASLAADLTEATGRTTALIATLVAKDSLFVLLALPSGSPLMKEVKVGRAELSKLVNTALLDLKFPTREPFTSTQRLYDLILAPIAKDLEGAKVECLMFNLNGPLRYVPMAALWDGSAFLAERYQISTFSLVARQYLGMAPAKRPWPTAFLGLTKSHAGFKPLPGVSKEVAAGVAAFGGVAKLDEAFTKSEIDKILRGRDTRLVHLGTHFFLSPGSNEETFMLLGDGSKWRLSELEASDSLGFRGVELLVASACETGVPTDDDTSIEGFGAYCQIKGAKSVISTLWVISDDATSVWMSTFYRLLGSGAGKGEALHRAQLAMIRGEDAATLTLPQAGSRAGSGSRHPKLNSGEPYEVDPKRPLAHPYYWAPFTLSGNWR